MKAWAARFLFTLLFIGAMVGCTTPSVSIPSAIPTPNRPASNPPLSPIEPLAVLLRSAGATVVIEPVSANATPFDTLLNEPVPLHALLTVNGERMVVYGFADAATAQDAAAMVARGGTSLRHTTDNGTITQEFLPALLGIQPQWWQWEEFVVQMGAVQSPTPDTVALVNRALDTTPLHADTLDAETVYVRLANLSNLDFERVTVRVKAEAITYGALPRGALSLYLPLPAPYVYPQITLWAGGERYELGENYKEQTPLEAGTHTYVLTLVDKHIEFGLLNDSDPTQHSFLEGKWLWTETYLLDQVTAPLTESGDPPYIRFTATPDPHQPGFQFEGYGGCNHLSGTYLTGAQFYREGYIVINEVIQTEKACSAEVMQSEQRLIDALPTAPSIN